MKKITQPLIWFMVICGHIQAQSISSLAEFLGYELGDQFTYHHRVVDYFEYAAAVSPKVQLIRYGQTYERRPLMVAIVTDESNMSRIDQIRKNNLIKAGKEEGEIEGKALPIVWLSYNVHGDESVSTEAALSVLHTLITAEHEGASEWLKELVVVLDPCINPDGRDRYVHFYNQYGNLIPNPDPTAFEHNQPWPGGRYNHYLFDLNRDWAWQTQLESQQRMKLYKEWMPQVHIDFHEMGMNAPYYFAPAAKPFHEVITPWQKEFQHLMGRNHAKYFDQEFWLFFTKEVFDLLYPSYGDTWPTYNGAIGATYEQGGGGRGGLVVMTNTGDTLRLKDRIDHHYTSSLSTIEVSHQHRNRLLSEFQAYFEQGKNNPSAIYKSYVVKGPNHNDAATLKAFKQLLDKQGIKFGSAPARSKLYKGFDYQNNMPSSFSTGEGDIVISAYQPLSRLVQVLMEPKTLVEDSATYDLTAWALPYVYGLEAYATTERILPTETPPKVSPTEHQVLERKAVAYLSEWRDFQDVQFLAALLNEGIRVRYAELPFSLEGKEYPRGTLIILRTDNPQPDFDAKMLRIGNELAQVFSPIFTGLVDKGKDFGSSSVRFIQAPKIAILGGDGVRPTSFGALWHYFEQQLKYPVSMLNTTQLGRIDLDKYDVLVLSSGSYGKYTEDILGFVRNGGKVIAMERAISLFANAREDEQPLTQLGRDVSKAKEGEETTEDHPEASLKRYEDRRRSFLSESVEGSIFKLQLDDSHPLAFGIGSHIHLIKRNSTTYPYLSHGWNVGTFQEDSYISGFTGAKLKEKISHTLALGVENLGSGTIIYMTDSPIFRAFWHSGKLLMGNAIFLVR